MEYVIVGDTDKFKGCLVCVCGIKKENAEECLHRMLTNPDDNDKMLMEGLSNLRIDTVEDDDCWWRQGSLD